MGPLTLGYERWANLSPETYQLQSFGHASVSEDGTLDIKLLNIDGNVMFEKTLTPEKVEEDAVAATPKSSAAIDEIAFDFVTAMAAAFLLL